MKILSDAQTKVAKFDGYCACGLMLARTDRGVCPRCGGMEKGNKPEPAELAAIKMPYYLT
jgi:hypothetical protein